MWTSISDLWANYSREVVLAAMIGLTALVGKRVWRMLIWTLGHLPWVIVPRMHLKAITTRAVDAERQRDEFKATLEVYRKATEQLQQIEAAPLKQDPEPLQIIGPKKWN